MDASSPLAGMQPSFAGNCGLQADGNRSYASFSSKNFEPESFNFRDLSMKKASSQTDYFNLQKPARGSSPTASLAADLSQNFHIDKSPQLPTPRRALFSNNFFKSHNVNLTTHPPPSSSPGPLSDGMEISSPLPHKVPSGSSYAIHLQSPTPELTPADSSMLSLPSPPTSDSLLEPPTLALPEKKRFGALRPGLSRVKGLSTSDIPKRPSSESQLPLFRFGNGITIAAPSSSLSLSEAFVESPPREKSLSRNLPVMPPARSKPVFGLTSNMRTNGSPVSGHTRKSSNPMARPRKQFRRTLSMFEHPEDVVRQEKSAPSLPSIMDIEPAHVPQLPHFKSEDTCDLPRITRETLIEVIDGKYNHHYHKLVIIDCRFEYEYNGGHIDGAVNFNDKEKLTSQLFEHEQQAGSVNGFHSLLIFHCEYSAHRAPIMAKYVRNRDRTVNAECYPQLTYPEAYILDGGYSSFFKDYRSRCFPQNYVEMDAKEHARACEMGMGKVKARSKLLRAQTFAFGQHGLDNSSPTAPSGRGRVSNDTMSMDVDMDLGSPAQARPVLDVNQSLRSRRMFSY